MSDVVLHTQKVAGISGSEAHLLQLLPDLRERGWDVHLYDAKDVEGQAAGILAEQADEVLHGPRARLGPPWAKDHRMALAATIVAG